MGLDTSTFLIVGVPFLHLGEIVDKKEEKELTDNFGNKTGKIVTLRTEFLKTHVGEMIEIGSNERNLLSSFSYKRERIEYYFDKFPDYEVWIHSSGNLDDLDLQQVICGRAVKSFHYFPASGRLSYHRAHKLEEVQKTFDIVKAYLKMNFGYEQDSIIYAVTSYSY